MSTVTAPAATADRGPSARERLLTAADELFYAEGINTVGIDRVIERAGVAKATLYSAFGSKDELIKAYLLRRHELRIARIQRHLDRHEEPRAQMLSVFDAIADLVGHPKWRGCPFLSAIGETRTDGPVIEVTALMRSWTHDLFVDLAGRAGVGDPVALADRLVLLCDGAIVASQLDGNPAAAHVARSLGELVIDAAL